jgi:hypothetical protein
VYHKSEGKTGIGGVGELHVRAFVQVGVSLNSNNNHFGQRQTLLVIWKKAIMLCSQQRTDPNRRRMFWEEKTITTNSGRIGKQYVFTERFIRGTP